MQERPNFLFCHLVKISPQKVVLNSHLEESERQRTLSAVEVEGVGVRGGRAQREERGPLGLWGKEVQPYSEGIGGCHGDSFVY